jgi:anti-repressor protein
LNNLVLLTNELVPVYKNEKGTKLVNARELHEWLGSGQDFSDWIKGRIEQYDFVQDKDFTIILGKSSGGRPSKEYIITLDMAKEISMVERTDRGKEARKYFIWCEEKLKEVVARQLSPMDQLRLQYEVLGQHEEKLNSIETRVNHIENKMVIEHGQAVTVKKTVDKRVVTVCFGSESPAYIDKELRNRVYRALWKDYKEYFNIVSYHDTLKKDIDRALELIKSWKPSGGLLRDIQIANTQLTI